MRILAFDTETTLIEDRESLAAASGSVPGTAKKNGKVLTSPWKTPTVVLGSYAKDGVGANVVTPKELERILIEALCQEDTQIVGHNLGFDIDVMVKFSPVLLGLFEDAMEEGRLHDTKILDQLYGLAVGRYDKPKYHADAIDKAPRDRWWREDMIPRTLEALAHDYCGMVLNKDNHIRLGYAQFMGKPIEKLPEDFREYALQDAKATLRVFLELKRRLENMGAKNWLSESIQIQAEHVCRDMDSRGIRIDRQLADELAAKFRLIQKPLQMKLVESGLGRWEPARKSISRTVPPAGVVFADPAVWSYHDGFIYKCQTFKSGAQWKIATPEFHLNTAAIQKALTGGSTTHEYPKRADGTPSLEYDYWVSRVPPEWTALRAWLDNQKIDKILSTYLNVYRQTRRIFPKWWVLGARSGRMSASCPSVQNVPKRKLGIRALFLADEGKQIIKSDYSAQEMFTLCESMLNMGIKGALYEALTSGQDMHKYATSLMLNKPIDQVTKDERQATKVLNFGVPGGLGADSLAEYAYALYGVQWTPKEAGAKRDKYLETFDDVNAYLLSMKIGQDTLLRKLTGLGRKDWAEALELSDWNVIKAMANHDNPEIAEIGQAAERQLVIELPTGFRRGNCRYTEGANCHFQGLAAAVTKRAMFLAYRCGLEILLVVHDEIVIQAAKADVEAHAKLLERAMLTAFREVCPNLGPYAKVEVTKGLDRWGPATDSDGKPLDTANLMR